jgi:hypothetical protein
MPEAKLPAIVRVLCSERGRSEDCVRTQEARRELRRGLRRRRTARGVLGKSGPPLLAWPLRHDLVWVHAGRIRYPCRRIRSA